MGKNVVAIVPAAGMGRRFGEGTNKTLEILAGRPMMVWALEALESIAEVTEIIPVIKDGDMALTADLVEEYHISKVRRIAPGGKERQNSVFHGLRLVDDRESIVIVHDGARPLIEPAVISGAIRQMEGCDGVVVGVPVKDTVKEARDGFVGKTLDRGALWSVQTPQIFYYDVLFRAYERAMKEGFYSTDDSALVERYGGTIKIVQGSYTNIKVTTPEDLNIAELFLKMREGRP
ncbi:MAG: 2-C-methyl-D-erythritol 4-phosphate cytidylyltransferase [Nitrospirae bacterium]|nr:2-C-methyl-D-erythritol 4-phosphate cytidylyltransferase [Nitrospirota bacterium]